MATVNENIDININGSQALASLRNIERSVDTLANGFREFMTGVAEGMMGALASTNKAKNGIDNLKKSVDGLSGSNGIDNVRNSVDKLNASVAKTNISKTIGEQATKANASVGQLSNAIEGARNKFINFESLVGGFVLGNLIRDSYQAASEMRGLNEANMNAGFAVDSLARNMDNLRTALIQFLEPLNKQITQLNVSVEAWGKLLKILATIAVFFAGGYIARGFMAVAGAIAAAANSLRGFIASGSAGSRMLQQIRAYTDPTKITTMQQAIARAEAAGLPTDVLVAQLNRVQALQTRIQALTPILGGLAGVAVLSFDSISAAIGRMETKLLDFMSNVPGFMGFVATLGKVAAFLGGDKTPPKAPSPTFGPFMGRVYGPDYHQKLAQEDQRKGLEAIQKRQQALAAIEKRRAEIAALHQKNAQSIAVEIELQEEAYLAIGDRLRELRDLKKSMIDEAFNRDLQNNAQAIDAAADRYQLLADIMRQFQTTETSPLLEAQRRFAESFGDGGDGMTPERMAEMQRGLDAIARAYAEHASYSISWEKGWTDAFKGFVDQTLNMADVARNVFNSIVSNMENALDNFVRTGKLNFKDLVGSIIKDLTSMALKQAFRNLFMMTGGGSGSGGWLASISSWFAGFFAKGGYIPPGKAGIVGEAGPELVGGPATVTPMDKLGGGPTIVNNYNISAIDSQSVAQFFAKHQRTMLGTIRQAERGLPGGSRMRGA